MVPLDALARRAALSLGALAALLGAADAQKRAAAVRTANPPEIDGVLDDAAWAAAIPFDDFHQLEPLEADPTERTEVRVLYDDDHLYLGIRLFDSDPSGIIATTRERDAFLDADDRVEILIDTFLDRRNGFWFQMNASGSKGDALVTNNGSDFNKPWDGIWEGRSRVDELGWVIEMAIPFKTLNFAEGLDTWGFNLLRYIGRKRERGRWNNANRDVRFFSAAEAGELTGLEGLRQGVGLDLVPFFTTSWNDEVSGDGDTDLLGEPGLDLFYKVTSNLTLSMTFNTDFAETEVDERQINLTRFPLFFPERRDFFLQDSGNFAFGGQRSRGGGRFRPFFSRRIGLADGQEVPLLVGAKLTGRIGDYNLGLLDVQTDDVVTESSGAIDGENLFVARVAKNVGEQSSIGGIVTNGNPTGATDNTVVGVDAQFRTTSFRGDKVLTGTLWGLVSDSEGIAQDDAAFGAEVSYPNDIWAWNAKVEEIQANFDAALGFVPRKDIRRYAAGTSYEPRLNGHVRNLEFSLDAEVVTDTHDVFETLEVELQPLGIFWESGDSFRIEVEHTRDELREDFEIKDGVVIPAEAYDFTRYRFEFDTASKRPVSVGTGFAVGDFFDGNRTDWWLELNLRRAPLLRTAFEYRQSELDLAGGSFTTQIAGARADLSFSSDLSWNNVLQWDNQSETAGLNSRLRWIPRPGHEVFLVVNETVDEDGSSLVSTFHQVAFKVAYTFRL